MNWAAEFIYNSNMKSGKWFLEVAQMREDNNLFYEARNCYRNAMVNFSRAYNTAQQEDRTQEMAEALEYIEKTQYLLDTNPNREEESYQNQPQ